MAMRVPRHPVLRTLVRLMWATGGAETARPFRERLLPDGLAHIVLRPGGPPLRLFRSEDDPEGATISPHVVAGPRTQAHLRAVPPGTASVGLLLAPGALSRLCGIPADELTGRHVPLELIWRAGRVRDLADALGSCPDGEGRLDILEACLLRQAADRSPRDRLVEDGLRLLRGGSSISAVARDLDLSRATFTRRFRAEVGLCPQDWLRVRRFDRALKALAACPEAPLASVAVTAGYADQAHMTRHFRAIAGLSPGAWRRARPANPRHVPLDPAPSASFKTGPRSPADTQERRRRPDARS